MIEVKTYTDFNGRKVKIGDAIVKVHYDGETTEDFGKVIKIYKEGYLVYPQTEKTTYKWQLLGKWTKKVK